MSREHGTVSTFKVSADPGCPIIPLVGKRAAQFTPEEDRFFDEGNALSNRAGTLEPFDDVTVNLPIRRWLTGKRRCVGGARCTRILGVTAVLVRVRGFGKGPAADFTEPPAPVPHPTALVGAGPPPSATAPTDARVIASATQRSSGETVVPKAASALDACAKAYVLHRDKAVLATCAEAFMAAPRPETALMLAETEFDRGHARKALDGAKKAIAIDDGQAEAYVFLGAAEQAAGRRDAAKDAYPH